MAIPLLRTKLGIPRPRPDRVPRPRLVERLNEGQRLGCKLTLVSAPAGFGKTTLLGEWIAAARLCDQPTAFCWLSLDDHDNDPAGFWAYVIAALQTVRAGLGAELLEILRSSRILPAESLLSGLVEEIAGSPGSIVLVLDDYHAITAAEIDDAVVRLVDGLPPQLRLVVSTRVSPPWPLARLRACQGMMELDADDLRFTPAEAAAFLNETKGLGLAPQDIAALDARTEGWIAGLQLAALSMRGREAAAFVKAFSGSHRFVLDYLLEEVLAGQLPGMREFLLQTSILERMTSSLCDAVTGREDSRSMLHDLEQADLFLVPLGDERIWYRYHHLFADLLRRQLDDADPGRARVLHRRAGEWYAAQGLMTEAVDHALAAGDVERAAILIERSAREVIYASEHATLLRWLEALPAEVIRTRPWLCVYLAWSRVWIGPRDQSEDWVEAAERALTRGSGADLAEADRRRVAGNICALRAYQAYGLGELRRAMELARQAVDLLPAGDTASGSSLLIAGDAYRWLGDAAAARQAYRETGRIARESGNHSLEVMATCRASEVFLREARLHEAFEASQEGLQLATLPGGRQLLSAGFPKLQMSELLREWNRLEEADACLQEGMAMCARWGPVGMRFGSRLAQASLQLARGDAGGTLAALPELDRLLGEQSYTYTLVPLVDAVRVSAWLIAGRLDEAAVWLEENRAGLEGGPGLLRLPGRTNLARVLYALGSRDRTAPYLDRALRLLDQLLPEASAAAWQHDVICLLVLKSLALHARDDGAGALATLIEALRLAEPGGYIRTFVDEGEPMARLLRQASARGAAPYARYAERLLAAWDQERRPAGAQPAEPLTARELEILRQLATGQPTAEIAARLFISIGTLRVHTQSIYRKLRAHRRREAVRRARETGLLP